MVKVLAGEFVVPVVPEAACWRLQAANNIATAINGTMSFMFFIIVMRPNDRGQARRENQDA